VVYKTLLIICYNSRDNLPTPILEPDNMRYTFLFLLCLITSSCVIGPQGTYYQPSTDEENVEFEGIWCSGAAGPPGRLIISLEDSVTLETHLIARKTGALDLSFTLDIEPGSSAQFLSNEIKVSSPNTGKKWVTTVDRIYLGPAPIGYMARLAVDEMINYNKYSLTSFDFIPEVNTQVEFSIKDFYPDSFNLVLPQIIASGQTYEIPPIRLSADEKDKAENCQKGEERFCWWTYNIESQNGNNPWVEIDGFKIKKGVISAGFIRKDKGVGGFIRVYFSPSKKWRFASDIIRVIDLDTAQEKITSFDYLALDRSYYTAFTAPFFTRGTEHTAATLITIILSPVEIDVLVVEFPEMLINGKRVRVKPITFKKEMGFGVIGFNC